MLNLIRNEWMKLWSKKATWIMTLLLVVFLVGIAGVTKWVESSMQPPEGNPTWEQNLKENQMMLEQQLASPGLDDEQKEQVEEELAITEYRLKNDFAPLDPKGTESYLLDSHLMMSFITLFVVIVAAGIVASEFSQGTIKMLLSRPVKRWKILTSKFAATILYAVLLTLVTFLTTVIVSYLFFDTTGGGLLDFNDGNVVEVSYWGRVLTLYGLQFIGVCIYATFAFMIGSVFRSSSLAIGLSIFLLFMGPNVVYFLSRYEISKYILFAHTDLTGHITGQLLVSGITMPFSIAVLAVYVLVFLIVSYWSFVKRDVTA